MIFLEAMVFHQNFEKYFVSSRALIELVVWVIASQVIRLLASDAN